MAWPAVGVVGGGEASAASQPATGGRSRRHDRRCFGRLEQEDQRLKKHYGRWMDIVRSLELESCILTKLTKPSVPVNFLCVIRRHFLACEDIAGGSELSAAVTFFSAKYRGPFGGSLMSGGGIIILRVIRRHFFACGRGSSCQPLHVQSTSDACRSLTTLTRPRREHQGREHQDGEA